MLPKCCKMFCTVPYKVAPISRECFQGINGVIPNSIFYELAYEVPLGFIFRKVPPHVEECVTVSTTTPAGVMNSWKNED